MIVEKELTLLAHLCLPYQYWEHVFSTTTYLHNRTITPILSFKSSYQALYHRSPDYQFHRNLSVYVIIFSVLIIIIKLIFALFLVSSWVIVWSIKVICVTIHPLIKCILLVMWHSTKRNFLILITNLLPLPLMTIHHPPP